MIPDPYCKTVKVPVKIVKGCLCLDSGERLPELEDGALGELTLATYSFKNPEEYTRFSEEEIELFLKEGTELMAQIDASHAPAGLKHAVHGGLRGVDGAGVAFVLSADQEIVKRGTKNAALKKCACRIPALAMTAVSINHAYSLISQAFEPHRVSHTGNVFAKVFFKRGDAWEPLKELRGY